VERDELRARALWRRAAEKGSTAAMLSLARSLREERRSESVAWLGKAAVTRKEARAELLQELREAAQKADVVYALGEAVWRAGEDMGLKVEEHETARRALHVFRTCGERAKAAVMTFAALVKRGLAHRDLVKTIGEMVWRSRQHPDTWMKPEEMSATPFIEIANLFV
jgi:hypothetical protein